MYGTETRINQLQDRKDLAIKYLKNEILETNRVLSKKIEELEAMVRDLEKRMLINEYYSSET